MQFPESQSVPRHQDATYVIPGPLVTLKIQKDTEQIGAQSYDILPGPGQWGLRTFHPTTRGLLEGRGQ